MLIAIIVVLVARFPHLSGYTLLHISTCCCSVLKLCLTLWPHGIAARQASLSFTISLNLLKLMPIESMMPFNHLILCHLFSSCPHSFPASGSFLMSQIFTSGGQSIVVSALASVLPMNTGNWSPLGWTVCISLQSKGLTRVFSNTTVQKHQFFGTQLYGPVLTPIHDHWKNHSFD